MPPSSPVLVATTTQSLWLRVWTAACLVLQDTTVKRKGSPKCLESARLVSNRVFVYFNTRYNDTHTVPQCQDFVLWASLFVSGCQRLASQTKAVGNKECTLTRMYHNSTAAPQHQQQLLIKSYPILFIQAPYVWQTADIRVCFSHQWLILSPCSEPLSCFNPRNESCDVCCK